MQLVWSPNNFRTTAGTYLYWASELAKVIGELAKVIGVARYTAEVLPVGSGIPT